MACPFFKEAYIAYCGACDFPYNPSIIEMEQLCFKNSFESCFYFNNLDAAAQIATDSSVVENGHEDVRNGNKARQTPKWQ